ncbi:MAG: PH domain-containing protein [Clostridia bacterium]|nr:PH domain-containing protein [Clostridia bacterium]
MGRYAERNLYENEWIVEKAPRDVWGLIGWWILGVLGCWLLLIPTIYAIKKTVIFTHTEYVLTNKRLICKTGVFHTHSKDIPLLEIQSVYVEVGFWGRIFNVGTMIIKSSRSKPIRLRIQDADDFKTTILSAIDQFELDRLASQSVWTAQAMLRGSKGRNPYGAYMGDTTPTTAAPTDPYAGYDRHYY